MNEKRKRKTRRQFLQEMAISAAMLATAAHLWRWSGRVGSAMHPSGAASELLAYVGASPGTLRVHPERSAQLAQLLRANGITPVDYASLAVQDRLMEYRLDFASGSVEPLYREGYEVRVMFRAVADSAAASREVLQAITRGMQPIPERVQLGFMNTADAGLWTILMRDVYAATDLQQIHPLRAFGQKHRTHY